MTQVNRTHPVWRAFKILIGMALLAIGFVGLFLPVLQGVLFMLVGLAILSTESRRARKFLQFLRQRYPGPYERARAFEKRLAGWVKARAGMKPGREASGDERAGGKAP